MSTLEKISNWVENNTFNFNNYTNLQELYENKYNKTISLIIPTLNEESTVGYIIDKIVSELNKNYNIIDELIVIDGGSKDKTMEILKYLENKYSIVKVIEESNILKEYKTKKGKGNQLWKALYYSKGDIVLYCDSDIKNFDIRMIYGMIGPLLLNNIKFIKGFYERPLLTNDKNINNNDGGRVTELCARPLLNMYYPELSGFLQPLSGEYGAYRYILENINYMTGYGVETKLLIDTMINYGIDIMGQVDLLKREHKHQKTNELTKMSFVIMDVILGNKTNLNKNLLMKNSKIENLNKINNYFTYFENNVDEILPKISEVKSNNKNNKVIQIN